MLTKNILEDGRCPLLHICPCQKQPFTKITVRYLVKTISGFPGSFLTLIRYLKPLENKNLRTKTSGFVLQPWILAMILERLPVENISDMLFCH